MSDLGDIDWDALRRRYAEALLRGEKILAALNLTPAERTLAEELAGKLMPLVVAAADELGNNGDIEGGLRAARAGVALVLAGINEQP